MTEGGRSTPVGEGLAPVIPLFRSSDVGDLTPSATAQREPRSRGSWHTTWTDDASASDDASTHSDDDSEIDRAEAHARAEARLLKRLRARSLSVREARSALVSDDVDAGTAARIVDSFLRHGYLDDMRLAEQLVHAGAGRKGQGRQAIAQTLAKRGIPRDIADAALAETHNDDAERALEYARHKAGSFRSVDRDTALRRLVGQLSRRGYPGSVALTAARTALDEASRPSVRFE